MNSQSARNLRYHRKRKIKLIQTVGVTAVLIIVLFSIFLKNSKDKNLKRYNISECTTSLDFNVTEDNNGDILYMFDVETALNTKSSNESTKQVKFYQLFIIPL